jgi:hypothetical protein
MTIKYMYDIMYAVEDNNIEKIKELLTLTDISPAYNDNNPIGTAAESGCLEIVRLLLNDPRVDPSDSSNYAIKLAHHNSATETVELLWSDQRVKDTLKKDKIELYNQLMKEDIKNKISEF